LVSFGKTDIFLKPMSLHNPGYPDIFLPELKKAFSGNVID